MRIYTKTGDSGETGLFAGGRVRKDDPRIEALGALDGLNAALGLVRAEDLPDDLDALVVRVQGELLELGAQIAAPNQSRVEESFPARLVAMEAAIDRFDATLPPLTAFILPGGCPAAAQLHMARCVCRRAERRIVSLASDASVSTHIIAYLNRLGDLLFVAARFANHTAGTEETVWEST